ALSQLINDTGDVRSVIRGHSLARDMFGDDARTNGILTSNPATGGPLRIQNYKQDTTNPAVYDIQTYIPIPTNNSATYGYDFTRWVLRISFGGTGLPRPVDQSFEILFDDYAPNSTATQFSGQGFHVFRVVPSDTTTYLNNPTAAAQNGWTQTQNYLMQPAP